LINAAAIRSIPDVNLIFAVLIAESHSFHTELCCYRYMFISQDNTDKSDSKHQ
jgi:hypothetical protein